MNYFAAARTSKGNVKPTNQDSILVMSAEVGTENAMLLAACDGLGGLSKGELASATLVFAFATWFAQELPLLIENGVSFETLQNSWNTMLQTVNEQTYMYGQTNGINLGTTVAAILLYGDRFFIVNVGDSRIYQIDSTIRQYTKDQTFVQQQVDLGRMTAAEAAQDARRNILTQCVGASRVLRPVFLSGQILPNTAFLVCSDGFRHTITNEEFLAEMAPCNLPDEETMGSILDYFIDLTIARGETDNISAILAKAR